MKKAFTLIELLAVVIILAVVSLVSTPIVLDVIDDARSNANKESAYGIVKAGEYFYAESLLDDSKKPYINGESNIYDKITVTGEKPEEGELYVNNKGQVAMSVTIGDNCYVKDYYSEVQELDASDENCELGYVGEDTKNPVVTFSIKGEVSPTGWYTESPYIHIKVEDLESGISNYRWCQGMNCDAANSENVETNLEKDVLILDSKETQVCVIAYDKANNETQLCSDVLQVDTVKPEFSGVMADSNIPLNQEIDLITGIEVTDVTSGINGTYKILNEANEEITSIDTSKSGVHEIRYVVTDNAGNETITTVTIEVSGTAPTITYTTETGVVNENGWANKDFIVTINVTDNSGHGIDSFNVCTAITDTCDPSTGSTIEGTTGAREIVQEDSNNRICVSVTDKSGKTSTLCSSAYKLDKTAPTAGTIKVNGSNEIKDWYTEDATIEVVDGSDGLSGHLETTSNVTSITENTTGTVVTVTTTDNAGNTSTRDYTIRVDKTIPTITIEEPSIDGENGWYISKPTITITANDTISTFDKLKWCQGIDCEPTEEITESTKEITIEDTEGTQICAVSYDKAGNETEKTCSNTIKVDTVDPAFSGIGPISVGLNESVDLISGVEVSDTTSGITGTFKTLNEDGIEITTVDTSKAGEYKVIYKVTDKAGREKEITRIITVATAAPSITYTPASGAINSNGWAKEDFIVTINVSDNSGHGIKSFNICTATTDTCEPSSGSTITDTTTASREIVKESNNNRICVQATDNYNQTSSVVCSDAYKLDKTDPTAGTIKVNGSSTIASWYTTDVTITAVDGSDSLSQHASTTVNTTSITSNTTGTTVTVTTKDKAGNESTRDYTIKVDKTQPTCTFTTLSYVGVNKTATIAVTCTNTVSGMSDKTLSASDFTVSNSNATITGVSKTAVTNGYKYTLTVKGVTAGTSTITLPASKVTTVAGLGNAAKTSGSITVTNVSLSSTSGTGYVGGSNLTATITNTNAGTLSCSSSSTSIATCSISGSTLTVVPVGNGTATITVTGVNGSPTATYTATSKVVTLGLNSTSGTTTVSKGNVTTTITGSNYGTLTCSSNSTSIATCSISGTTLTITPVAAGTATITVTESRLNKTTNYTLTIEEDAICIRATTLHTETCTRTESSYYCSSYGNGSTITYGSLGTSGVLTTGDAFDCDVNGDGVYDSETERFYYVSDYYDSSTKTFNDDYAVLIYYNNTTAGIADNTYTSVIGTSVAYSIPVEVYPGYYGSATVTDVGINTLKTNLPTTSQWTNVSLLNTNRVVNYDNSTSYSSTFDYSGYAARLLTYQEIDNLCNKSSLSSCNYLLENTTFSSSSMGTNGYWLENRYYASPELAYWVSGVYLSVTTQSSSSNGVRPAIEVPKTEISLTTPETLYLTSTSGKTVSDRTLTSTIMGNNYGTLSCSSSNPAIATCSISGTTLTITTLSVGDATITISGSSTDKTAIYSLEVLETIYVDMNCSDYYLVASECSSASSGTIQVTSSRFCAIKREKESLLQYNECVSNGGGSSCDTANFTSPNEVYESCCTEYNGCY